PWVFGSSSNAEISSGLYLKVGGSLTALITVPSVTSFELSENAPAAPKPALMSCVAVFEEKPPVPSHSRTVSDPGVPLKSCAGKKRIESAAPSTITLVGSASDGKSANAPLASRICQVPCPAVAASATIATPPAAMVVPSASTKPFPNKLDTLSPGGS